MFFEKELFLNVLLLKRFSFLSYHQKVPEEVPELESTEIGMASPVEFPLPSHHPRWKPEIFAAFDVGKAKSQVRIFMKNQESKVKKVN